ncbi:putative pathogenesis-related protein [Lachnellula hyalina]|uniref:Putative pathogenesis-related protein n=1 Tax=Lachnellula hyalina TaxID=1316788 RepID=A0A8H8RAP4_9HELO|nr:putative pathogenesis-related protein [Lachnellula hyalina]TVY30668.1 putative pathogenesis-related protein [Lachnellula hyalina]
MRTATIITLFSAGLTVATPMHQLFHHHAKKALVTDIVTDIVTVYVTAGEVLTPAAESTTVSVAATSAAESTTVAAAATSAAAVSLPVKEHFHHSHDFSAAVSTEAAPTTISSSVEVSIPAPTSSAAPTTVVPTSVAAPSTAAASSVVTPSSVAVVASSSAAAPVASATDYSSTALFNHNQHRANHSASDVTWNATLAGFAATSAAKCIFKHDNDGYGQNIAAWGASNGVPSDSSAVANAITEAWYNGEVGDFPFNVADITLDTSGLYNGHDILHFSQVVWKDTVSVGCASATCGPDTVLGQASYDSVYTVCNYYPAGNVGGEYITNVGTATGAIAEMTEAISV